ncbi:MAG: organoarsenical effux MFS transporter ArsJ [Myxococcales bacterium]|nr:organoarsenical effux MFS transporter ArsJ [Myxococcales bacterium]
MRHYVVVTAAYWAFTLTDGALRMLVLLHFHGLGYTPVQLAFLFLFYELFGVVTNLLGGWIAARMGVRVTLLAGLALQIGALGMLSALDPAWARAASVAFVMAAQALSGVAKDLTKMSSKSAIKTLVPADAHGPLFRWVALLTGSKNALKGAGFFLGSALLTGLGFRPALWAMAAGLAVVLAVALIQLPAALGRAKGKAAFRGVFSMHRDINVLSAARFFLFGARDIWFVVAVPVFLSVELGWGFTSVGAALALWVIGYGVIQSVTPSLLAPLTGGVAPGARVAVALAGGLALTLALVPLGLHVGAARSAVVLAGLGAFGVVFAINSSVHSYLILAYSDGDKVALNVGFYYMANAGGRLVGTLLSGLVFQAAGLVACLWTAVGFAAAAGAVSLALADPPHRIALADARAEGAE